MVKFHFTASKLRKKYTFTKTFIGKYQISKCICGSRCPLHPLPTPMLVQKRNKTTCTILKELFHVQNVTWKDSL